MLYSVFKLDKKKIRKIVSKKLYQNGGHDFLSACGAMTHGKGEEETGNLG